MKRPSRNEQSVAYVQATTAMALIRGLCAVCAAILLTTAPLQSSASETPAPAAIGAEQQYIKSVAAMRSLEVPPFVAYQSSWKSTGFGFSIEKNDDRIVIAVGTGGKKASAYEIDYRSSDKRLGVRELPHGVQFAGAGQILNPTWAGAYDILRYGLRGSPSTGATPSPQPSGSGDPATIATVTAIAAANYRVEDRGPGTCPAGTPGRILKLIAYRDPQSHPLTEVTIDLATDRFCNMRFNLKETGLAGVTGDYAFDFTSSGPYWLVSGGIIDLSIRVLGISANHTVLSWVNTSIATPAEIPAAAFIDATPAPKPSMQ